MIYRVLLVAIISTYYFASMCFKKVRTRGAEEGLRSWKETWEENGV